jgi:Zn-dependent protease
MSLLSDPLRLVTALPVILLALTIHEWAHAYSAYRLGDPTAYRLGRMTLNPLAHLDLFGTLAIVLIGFGCAKPVPVNPNNLREPRKHMMWIAAAGPISNIAQALVFGLVLQFMVATGGITSTSGFFFQTVIYGIFINCALAVFNLLPVPPLDGSKIIYGLIPSMTHESISKLEHYGPMVLMGLIAFGYITGQSILWGLMGPPVYLLVTILSGGVA